LKDKIRYDKSIFGCNNLFIEIRGTAKVEREGDHRSQIRTVQDPCDSRKRIQKGQESPQSPTLKPAVTQYKSK
jgi:hypothetical protein